MTILEQYIDQLEKLRARERELSSCIREHACGIISRGQADICVRVAILRTEIEEITEVIEHLYNLFSVLQ